MLTEQTAALFSGFSKLEFQERLNRLLAMGALTEAEVKTLKTTPSLPINLAENLIENVIGYFQLPLGVAANLNIDGQDVAVPMAVEETSIIAAVSKTAKWVRSEGAITTEVVGECLIGQIQIANVKDYSKLQAVISHHKQFLIEAANENAAPSMFQRGGGVKDITIRRLLRDAHADMAVIHVHVDPCDAMGANVINQICEYLKAPIEKLTDEQVTMCILSNLNDQKLTRATVTLPHIDPELGRSIEEASRFAQLDPYRASTHNKGVLNGIDPVLIATGNDWRAVEAGIHAYAARDGQYRAITTWRMEGEALIGHFEAPLVVGTVGGMTNVHPMAKLSLNMLGVNSANDLSRIIAAVGLVQNLGALCALTTVGIIQGHMKLHIANLTLSAGANESEQPLMHQRLEEILQIRKRITLSHAIEVLNDIRKELTGTSPQAAEQTV